MIRTPKLNSLIKSELTKQYPKGETRYQKALRQAQPKSQGEEAFWFQLTQFSVLPRPNREQRLVEGREWRVDFVWFPEKIVFEIEGGVYTRGRHTRGKGFSEDIYKYRAIEDLGYKVYRFTTEMVLRGEALRKAEELFS